MSDTGTTCVTRTSSHSYKSNNKNNSSANDEGSNLIKLCLNKPKSWNWELSTSKSSPNIAFPKIQLYDTQGELLAETEEADCSIRSQPKPKILKDGRNSRRNSILLDRVNIPDKILEAKCDENKEETPLKISHGRSRSWQEQNFNRDGPEKPILSNRKLYKKSYSQNFLQVDQNNNSLPKHKSTENINAVLDNLVSSFQRKGIECKVHRRSSRELSSEEVLPINSNFQLGKSKSTTLIPLTKSTPNSNSSEHREKKKYKRSHSVNSLRFSNSILERISEYKKNNSSTESEDEKPVPLSKRCCSVSTFQDVEKEQRAEVELRPKYTLRTSKAGTLIVCEESFRHRRVRTRRPRSLSRPLEDKNTNDDNSEDLYHIYSPEKIKTEYEYIGNLDNSNKQESETNRYQKKIDNIERMLAKLSVQNPKSENRRPKSLNENIHEAIRKEELLKSQSKAEKKKKRISFEEKVAEIGNSKSSSSMKLKGSLSKEEGNNQTIIDSSRTEPITNNHPLSFANKSGKSESVQENKSDKLPNRKQFRRMKRSLSADSKETIELLLSSSDDDDSRGERRSRRPRRKQGNGDQVVAVKSNGSGVLARKEQPNTCFIEPTDQVLLRLVRRLASLQQQQQEEGECKSKIHKPNSIHFDGPLNNNQNQIKDCPNVDFNNNNQNKSSSLSCKKRDPLSVCQSVGDKASSPQNQRPEKPPLQNDCQQLDKENIMGSNVSRHSSSSGKGLSGRRSLSSGNLCNGKSGSGTSISKLGQHSKASGRIKSGIVNRTFSGADNDCQIPDDTCSLNTAANYNMTPPIRRDRNKYCGSLPNHLDVDMEPDNEQFSNVPAHFENDNVGIIQQRGGAAQNEEKVEYVTVAAKSGFCGTMPGKPSSPYNSSSGKGSITSTSNLGSNSTFKIGNENKLELKLPTQRVNFDPSCDQGYGSERSPEDEVPPSLPSIDEAGQFGSVQSITQDILQHPWTGPDSYEYQYDFITKDCTFFVQIVKGPRGLGLSISGGIDSNAAFPGLIRIKRLFPHQAAWATGMLLPGDIILEVNGVPLSGLTNYEALEVLRTTPNTITLTICRPNDEQYKKLSPPSEPPRPPQRTSLYPQNYSGFPLEPLSPLQTNFCGDFEIVMVKQQGSLGFTLRKEDESVLGHYVRALVREPATTDGRIKPGDKIVAVNDVPLSPMTHEEAVIFLRQAADTVKLRLFRDIAQTPVAALSPTNPDKGFPGTLKSKTYLRPEAINLLSDLAYRKHTPPCDSSGSSVKSGSNTSPRRLRRGVKGHHGNQQSHPQTGSSTSSANYVVCSQGTSSSCSDSEASTLSQNSLSARPVAIGYYQSSGAEGEGHSSNDTYTIKEDSSEAEDQPYYNQDEEIQDGIEDDEYDVYDENQPRPDRPRFLDLGGQTGNTPVVNRKPMFQFSVPCNGYELNNLDNDMLDAPIYQHLAGTSGVPGTDQFVSLPCETFIVACKTESDLKRLVEQNECHFHHKNPAYQSAHIPAASPNNQETEVTSSEDEVARKEGAGGTKSLLKWKGVVMLSPEGEEEREAVHKRSDSIKDNGQAVAEEERENEQITTAITENEPKNIEGYKVLSLELNRGWNSRLGFSLKTDAETSRAYISAIYRDSVAARDGRLRVGDQLIRVNDETVERMATTQIIDLLRIIRGAICLTILRRDDEERGETGKPDEPASSD